MEKIKIGDQEYEMVFNMYTYELIEEKYKDAREPIKRLTESQKPEVKLCRDLCLMMVRAAMDERQEPEEKIEETVRTLGEKLKKMHYQDYSALMLRPLMIIEVANGMRSETTGGGEADDEKHDAWLEEDAKNA